MKSIHETRALRKLYWQFERSLRRTLPQPEARILGAVSGGSDSVVLAALLAEAQRTGICRVILGHVHHGLRPEAGDEKTHVRRLAQDLGLEVQVRRVEIEPLRKREGWSLEQAARAARFSALAEIATESGCRAVATAHHLDDQAETVLLRVLRGVGPRGLGAMAPSSRLSVALREVAPTPATQITLIRPLLDVRRSELRQFRELAELPCCEDPSNQDRAILRNRIRLDLLPHLVESYNPRLVESLADLARWARLEAEPLTGWAQTVLEEVCLTRGAFSPGPNAETNPSIVLDAAALMRHPTAIVSRVLWMAYQWLRGPEATLTSRHMADLLDLLGKLEVNADQCESHSAPSACAGCAGGRDVGELHLSGKIRVRLAGGRLFFEPHHPYE